MRIFSRPSEPPDRAEVVPARPGGLGTFGGVFTPSILTILGVIMYLRFGWVVGQVGLLGAWAVVTISTGITFLTALSVAEISTDQRVRVGGAYYMISRSLGIEAGGAVGIPLYIALALSVALYTVGFAESIVNVFPSLSQRWVGIVTTVGVAGLALTSARIAIRAQYFIMAAIGLSLVSLAFGSPVESTELSLAGLPPEEAVSFWVVLAVFFPAVTGIMAGVNMSGDLEDPERSIPRGTLAAVGVGYLIYMGLPFLLSLRADSLTLVEDPLVMRRIAFWGDAILLGVWGATLSSAVGSILGAPRVLQALARDGVLPRPLRWLGQGSGPDDEPRAGTLVTLGVALVAAWVGELNLIAPVLTMFFLTTYGVLNLAAGLERLVQSPSFRPRFRVAWWLSILGALGSAAVMVLINALATVVAVLVALGIFVWLERRELTTTWGDVRRGLWMAITRAGLLRLRKPVDPKNWRPHVLVLSGAPTRRWHLIDLASSFSHRRGLLTVAMVLAEKNLKEGRKAQIEATIREYLAERGLRAFVRVMVAPDPYQGAGELISAYGLGSIAPNTVVLGGNEDTERLPDYCRMVRRLHAERRNVVIVRGGAKRGFGKRRRIDIWWGGLQRNGGLMLILAYLLSSGVDWRGATVTLKMVVPDETAAEGTRKNLAQLMSRSRTGAEYRVIVADGRDFHQILSQESAAADLVFLGITEPGDDFTEYYRDLLERTSGLPTTLYVLSAEDLDFGEVLFESETAGQGL